MQTLKSVQWGEVRNHWKAHQNYNNDGAIPKLGSHMHWHHADYCITDVSNIYLSPSQELKNAFGSYHLTKTYQTHCNPMISDNGRHWIRVEYIRRKIRSYEPLPSLILVRDSVQQKYIVADGNHRAIAYLLEGKISSMSCYIGSHPQPYNTFSWANRSFGDY